MGIKWFQKLKNLLNKCLLELSFETISGSEFLIFSKIGQNCCTHRFTKGRRLSLLTNSVLVYEPKSTPYLPYGCTLESNHPCQKYWITNKVFFLFCARNK
jgi:hypothetical protein